MLLEDLYEALVMDCPLERFSSTGQPSLEYALDYDIDFFPEFKVLHLPFLRKYTEWYAGSSRIAYMDRDRSLVYKVPITNRGYESNVGDAHLYQVQQSAEREGLKNPIAKCRLLHEVILEMELVRPLTRMEIERRDIDRIFADSDGYQVGETQEGKIVFFDL